MKIVQPNEPMKKGDIVLGHGVENGYLVVDFLEGNTPEQLLGYVEEATVVIRAGEEELYGFKSVAKKLGKTIHDLGQGLWWKQDLHRVNEVKSMDMDDIRNKRYK